jgi:enoyl-CoA hydratase/carnithine racemase
MDLHVTSLTIEDGVGIIRLNRPDRGNSWTHRMNTEYRWLHAHVDRDPKVNVVVVTGTGKQFCVGADFKALEHYEKTGDDYVQSLKLEEKAQPGHGVRDEFNHEMVWHWGLQKPVIAAINGACAGIAVALAAFCDLRYAASGAKVTTSTPRLGMPAEYGLSWILPRIVGLTHTADILLTGRIVLAEELQTMGFLNAVFPIEEFEQRVLSIAKSMASSVSPIAAKTAKRQLYADLISHDVGGSVETSKTLIGELMKYPDFTEAMAARKEKRAPRFRHID